MNVVGIDVRTTNAEEADPKTARIGALWQRFFRDGVLEKVRGRKGGAILGVYTSYESDHTGLYTLIVGAEAASLDGQPAGLAGIAVPAARYLVFKAKGPMPKALIEEWGRIWQFFASATEHARAYTSDFERHDPTKPDEVEIHIAIR
jgi:predicted transcriptional regulator YdeE